MRERSSLRSQRSQGARAPMADFGVAPAHPEILLPLGGKHILSPKPPDTFRKIIEFSKCKWLTIILPCLLFSAPVPSAAQHIVMSFDAPGPESRGLAWDGQYLYCADAELDSIFKIHPATGQILHSIPFDLEYTYGSGITWSGDGALWVTRFQYFYKLHAESGAEMANFHCPGS
jgi:hypothetical protein